MSQWTGEQRAFAIEAYFKANDFCAIARRRFCSRYNIRRLRDASSEDLIKLWVRRFRATSSAANNPRPAPSRSLRDNPRQSVRKRAAALRLPKTIVDEILKKDLKFHPFKIQIVQALKPNDNILRKSFYETMLQRFRTNGCYWSPKGQNPRLKHQQPLHSPTVSVWCALSSRGNIGPYFLENRQGQPNTSTATQHSTSLVETFNSNTIIYQPQSYRYKTHRNRDIGRLRGHNRLRISPNRRQTRPERNMDG
uniref:SFRICE_030809 n=1 Tax=Spodoptera frugiperda TaxID=7108 RepID=A0A2H1V0U8_SPOFR